VLPRVALILAAGALALSGCSHGSHRPPPKDAVVYSIGVSTDPYGNSAPAGFGVVTGLPKGHVTKVQVQGRGLGGFNGAEWLEAGRILVARHAPPLQRPYVYRYDGELHREGEAPIRSGDSYAWSPRKKLFAYEPPKPCRPNQPSLYGCYRQSGRISIVREDGSDRHEVIAGHLMGWTVDGRIAFFKSYQRATPRALDLATGKVASVLPGWKVALPIWTPDRRYAAAITNTGIVVARGDGRTVQTIHSPYVLSMIAWSPVADRLVYTTSGFPDPHQLFVVDRPGAKPRLLYHTGAVHFDWVTWSPDGRWLLLDEEHKHRWLLLRADHSGMRRPLPRLGGRPLWCCPVNAFSAGGDVRNS